MTIRLRRIAWFCCMLLAGAAISQPHDYLPRPDFNPLRVNVNVIVLQRADGSGNFQDSTADVQFLRNMMNVTNEVYSKLVDRNEDYYPGQNLAFLSNAKVQFMPRYIFIRDETGWNNRNDHNFAGVPYLSGWYLDSLDREIYRNDTLPKAINLYFTTDGALYEQMVAQKSTTDYNRGVFFKQHAASEIPYLQAGDNANGKYHSMRCHVANVWLKLWWKRHVLQEPDWTMEYEAGKSIAHELGHLMGLSHTTDQHLHALMRTRFGGLRDYLTVEEIAKIHQMFAFYPSLWQFVPGEVRYGSPKADCVLTGEEEWAGTRRLYADVIVKSGAALTITGELVLPDDGHITVEKGARLFLEGGVVQRMDGTSDGLIVYKRK